MEKIENNKINSTGMNYKKGSAQGNKMTATREFHT